MEKLSLCRVCLGEDVRLNSIVGTHLQEMYESLVLMPLETKDGKPVLACYICCARLNNCYELRKSCLQSEELFTQMLSSNQSEQVKLQGIRNKKKFTLDTVIHLSIGHELEMNADNVGVDALKREVKRELNYCEDIGEDALEENSVFDNVQSADSGADFVMTVKEEQTGDMTIDPTPKASTQDDQENPEGSTSINLKHHVLVQDTLQDLSHENSTHTAQKSLQCNICNKSFLDNQYLAHMRTHTSDKPYHCDLCNKRFSLKGQLRQHLRTHTGEKPYQCNICNKRFSFKGHLRQHLRTHTNEKPHQCHICNKQFSSESYSTIHIRTHTGEKPYHCDLCNKRFSFKGHLSQHLRTHTGEKPYYCDICKKQFSQKSNLIRHRRTHSGEKLFHCDICKNQFTTRSSLICHIRTHTGEKPYQCFICKKEFSQKVSLERHIRTHTDYPYQCHTCNKQFSQTSHFNSHMQANECQKPHQSDILCNTQFTKSSFSHSGEKPYHCETCKKQFTVRKNLLKHMRTHTGDKPHECNMCKRSFSHLCHLRRHMATHTDKELV